MAIATGRRSRRAWTTPSSTNSASSASARLANARAALARLPFKPVMLVGFQHGGGGVYSHTACTLMTWTDLAGRSSSPSAASTGSPRAPGVFLYDGARSWDDRLFSDFWYLDGKLATTPAVNEIDSEAETRGRVDRETPLR